jgi:hypothetical protein
VHKFYIKINKLLNVYNVKRNKILFYVFNVFQKVITKVTILKKLKSMEVVAIVEMIKNGTLKASVLIILTKQSTTK